MAAFAALALVSCSNDKEIPRPNDLEGAGKEIAFRTFADKGTATRAAITTSSSLNSFTVTGWWKKTTDADETNPKEDQFLFNAYDITRREAGINNWEYEEKRYWPTDGGDVSFYAYSPASTQAVQKDKGLKNHKQNGLLEYHVPAVGAQEDFLMAHPDPLKTGTVKFNFAHVLSRVKFFAKTTNKDIVYTVGGVELINVYDKGTIKFEDIYKTGEFRYRKDGKDAATTGQADATAPTIKWSTIDAKNKHIALDMGASRMVLENQFRPIIADETNAIMVLPQRTAYAVNYRDALDKDPASTLAQLDAAIAADIAAGNFLIKVYYKAKLGNVWYKGSKTEYAVKYFPVADLISGSGNGHSFEIGRQYNFYFTFGSEVGGEIKFETKVSNWDDANNNFLPETQNFAGRMSTKLAKLANSSFNPAATTGPTSIVTLAQIHAVTSIPLGTNLEEQKDFRGLEYFEYVTRIELGTFDADKKVDLCFSGLPRLREVSFYRTGASSSTINSIDIANLRRPLILSIADTDRNSSESGANIISQDLTINTLKVWEGMGSKPCAYNDPEMWFHLNKYSGNGGTVTINVLSIYGAGTALSSLNDGYSCKK